MKTFNKYSIIDLYIKSLDVNIKYKVIAGIEEFGILLYKNLCNANIKVDYIFDDYNYINNQNLQELNFISLEDLKKISDNTLVLISDRDPEIFQKVYKKLKTNGMKYICPNELMKIIRLLPESQSNLYPIGHYFSLYPDNEKILKKSDRIFNKNITVKDIDFNERECIVFGKGSKERVVYFDARTKIHLQNYLKGRTDNNPALFVSLKSPHKRLKIGGVEVRLREFGKQLGLQRVHPHKFRRTLATMAIDKGMPIEQLQQLLGHRKIDTTLQYAMVKQSNVKIAHRKYIG